jgi:Kef-type K+ transport system membrane component KefB
VDSTTTQAAAEAIPAIQSNLRYIALLFALVVLPKALQRYRVPGAITSLLLGIGSGALGWFEGDPTVQLLSTFGIVSLFLFAGLEISGPELQRGARILIQHGLIWSLLAFLVAFLAKEVFGLSGRAAALTALAIVTPSTGFILSSLTTFGLGEEERFAVKAKAIAAELLALGTLFVVLQSTSVQQMALSSAVLLGMILVIPLTFRLFAGWVAPHAPRSEFAFLLMVAVLCAYVTRHLGVYYLVGAFIVGVAAQRFRTRLPAMSSEKMVDALEAFGSVFIPFYFFNAGLHVRPSELSLAAFGLGVLLLIVAVPLRVILTVVHRRWALGEAVASARRVGTALVPTLVFTLVLADILRARFAAPEVLVGALIIYTIVNTTIPAFILRTPPPAFEQVEAGEVVPAT